VRALIRTVVNTAAAISPTVLTTKNKSRCFAREVPPNFFAIANATRPTITIWTANIVNDDAMWLEACVNADMMPNVSGNRRARGGPRPAEARPC